MAKELYALLNGDDEIIRTAAFDPAERAKQGDPIGKGWRWMKVGTVEEPHDPATERLVDKGVQMRDGKPVRVMQAETKPPPPVTTETRLAAIEARLNKLEGR